MGVYHHVTICNQSKSIVTLTRMRSHIQGCSWCFDEWGPGSFSLGPGEKRLLLLKDDNGVGYCDGNDKHISWYVSDRKSHGQITYQVTNDPDNGWCVIVSGPAVFAETGGNSCLPDMAWVGRPDSPLAVQATIYL